MDPTDPTKERKPFPLKSETMQPIRRFNFGGHWLSLYYDVVGRIESAPYSIYWDDPADEKAEPIHQHEMTDSEVFTQLSLLLDKQAAQWERLRAVAERALTVASYVSATVGEGNTFPHDEKLHGDRADWRLAHAGRMRSSERQLDALEHAAREALA